MIKRRYILEVAIVGLLVAGAASILVTSADHTDVSIGILSENTAQEDIVQIVENNATYTYSIDQLNKQAKLIGLESNEKSIWVPPKMSHEGEEYLITTIEKQAVYCPEATEIIIDSENGIINEQAFGSCRRLEKVEINGISEIGPQAFRGCLLLTDVSISGDNVLIGICAFEGCGLMNFSCTSNTVSFGYGALRYNVQLTNALISGDVTYLGDYSFYCCGFTTLQLNFADGVSIGDRAFEQCTSLTGVKFTGKVTELGKDAFADCTSLASISFEEGLTTVGYGAFSDCNSLKYVYLPSTVSYVDKYVFWKCTSLETVIIDGNEAFVEENAFIYAFNTDTSKTYLKIPASSMDDLKKYGITDGVRVCAVIPANVIQIKDKAFQGCSDLQEVIFHDGVQLIGNNAFESCSSLTSIIIPEGVKQIGHSAFYNCTNIRSIVIADSVENIGNSAFSEISKLQSVCFLHESVLPEMPRVQEYNEKSLFYGDEDCHLYISSNINGQELVHQLKNSENIETYEGYVVIFDPQGGVLDRIFEFAEGGQTIAQPQTPLHLDNSYDYEFLGWYLDDEKYDFNTPITSNIQLTALWDQKSKEEQQSYLPYFIVLILIIVLAALLIWYKLRKN